jgi:hypothetical protein
MDNDSNTGEVGGAETVDFVSFSLKNDSKMNNLRENFYKFLVAPVVNKSSKKIAQFQENQLTLEQATDHTILLRTPSRLPFSGEFVTSINKRRIAYKNVKNFNTFEYEDFLQTETHILHEIKSIRNNDDTEYDEIDYGSFLFLRASLQIAQFIGRHLQDGAFAIEPKGRFSRKERSLNSMIDRNYFQLLLSLESFNMDTIASMLKDVVRDFASGVLKIESILSPVLKETDSSIAVKTNLKDIIDSSKALSVALEKFDQSQSLDENSTLFNQLAMFIRNIDRSATGKLLTSELTNSTEMVTPLNLQIIKAPNRADKERTLKQIIIIIVNEYFILERQTKVTEVKQLTTKAQKNRVTLATIIKNLLQYELESYASYKDKFEHLEKGKLIEKGIDEFKAKKGILDDILKWFRNPKIDAESIKTLIFNQPSDFGAFYTQITSESNSEARFANEINDWTRKMIYNPKDKSQKYSDELNILNIIATSKESPKTMDTTTIHKKLLLGMERMKNADNTYHTEHTTLSSTKNIPAGVSSQQDLDKLEGNRESLSNNYKKEIQKLKSNFNKNTLEVFVSEVEKYISGYANKLSQARISDMSNRSYGAPRTMMIGLGQAGQQITRAAVAKLLNTQADARSRNMLKGLGIEISADEINDIEKEQDYDNNKQLFKRFDNANILAINAGDELKRMLGAPYNFIWGTRDDPVVRQQEDANCIRPATNLVLLDKEGTGSGNRMGKGRAYAVRAQRGLQQAIQHKRNGQNITQVCLVHSFAGGSGSGMILPFLSIIKRELPNALIWVFSAGVEYESDDPFKEQNTTYITSDILQAHYHAIHHIPEQISLSDWEEFKIDVIQGMLASVNEAWMKVKSNFTLQDTPIPTDNKTKWAKFGFTFEDEADKSYDKHYDMVQSSIPKQDETAKIFSDTAMDPSNVDKVKDFWKEWMAFAQDQGSRCLENNTKLKKSLRKNEDDEASQLRTGYQLTYSNVMAIAQGVTYLNQFEGDVTQAEGEIRKQITSDNSLIEFIRFGASATCSPADLPELKQKIETFAREMRSYHGEIEALSARIQMMVGAREDTRIKHIILSNSHLDRAASFYKGKESPYEIYNSVMVDVYVNLIHGLVEQIDYTNSDDLQSSASSFEFMDLSDLRTVTAPPIHATLVDLTNTFETNNAHGFNNETDVKSLKEDPVFTMFKLLFERGESPLYNAGMSGTQQGGDAYSIQALYMNYLESKSGIRMYDPVEVIHNLAKEDVYVQNKYTLEHMGQLIELIKNKYQVDWDRCNHLNFKESELLNTINWLALLPVKLLSMCYSGEDARKSFIENVSELKSKQENRESDEDDSMFNPNNRKNKLANHIEKLLPSANSECKKEMLVILTSFDILSPDHLAAMPSAMFYEFAPNILAEKLGKIGMKFTPPGRPDPQDATIELLQRRNLLEDNPPPSRNLAMKSENHPLASDDMKKMLIGIRNKNPFDTSKLNYLRIPALNDGGSDGGPLYPYLEINSKFMQHFSQLKIETGELYPEFNSITLLDKLIDSSSDNRLGSSRHSSETPNLRNASKDLRVYSNPRKLYEEETPISVLIRMSLLGHMDQNNSRSTSVFKEVINSVITQKEQPISLFESMILNKLERINLRESFTINKFVNSIAKRIDLLTELEEGDDPDMERIVRQLDSTSNGLFKNFVEALSNFKTSINTNEDGVAKESFSKSYNQAIMANFFSYMKDHYTGDIEQTVETIFVENDDKMDKTDLAKQITALGKFFSRLTDVWFQAKRQFNFLQGQMEAGKGVAFELEGTVDSVRSKPKRYLALINNAYSVNPMKAKSSIFHFFDSYLDGGVEKSTTTGGKVYLQRLESGPIANITLLQEKAAIFEIANSFKGLMNKLKEDGFNVATDTLVHPYAFLRNILWLSTMTNIWVERPNEEYLNQFIIEPSIIKKIFSQPSTIEALIETVQTDDSFVGYQFSEEDVRLWSQLRLCGQDMREGTDHYRERIKAQIQIPDLLMIKAWQYKLDESSSPALLADGKDEKHSDLLKLYPPVRWKNKFNKMGLLQRNFDPIRQGTNETEDIWSDWGEDTTVESTSVEETSEKGDNPWYTALKKWVEFAEKLSEKRPDSSSQEE